MSFLYPQFLFGLLALSIPIIIHLFNFRKTKRIYFSSNQFLQHVKEASSSKLKLKHLLILAARLLFIFFLVMAFAQPYIPTENDSLDTNKVVIYLDNSMSMSNEVDVDLTGLDVGVQFVGQIIDLYPSGTQFQLLTNDFAPYSNTFKSATETRELTTELRLSGISRSFNEILNRIKSQSLLSGVTSQDIYLISDFQKSTMSDLETLKSDSTHNYNLLPLQFISTTNVMIDSVYLENPFLMTSERAVLNVVVRNMGETAVNDLLLKVFVNDIQAASASVNIDPNSSTTTKFDLGFSLEDENKCRISFEEYPVTFDNEFYFTINQTDRVSVLEIKTVKEKTVVEQVFGNEEIFRFVSLTIDNLDYSRIRDADLVVLNELENIDGSMSAIINEFIEDFGNVLLIPSINADLNSYQTIVKRPLLKQDTSSHLEFEAPDFSNPFYANVFETENKNFAMPEATSVLAWGRDRDAILKFRNSTPFLSRFEGSGFIYLMAAPLKDEFTNFHRHAIFVPVMYKIASSSLRNTSELYFTLNEPLIKLKIDSIPKDDVFRLVRGGNEIIPAQRITTNDVYIEVPKHTLEAGFYDLFYQNNKLRTLSFNSGAPESNLEQYDPQYIKSEFKNTDNVTIFEAENVDSFKREIKERYLGMSLWKYALILALIFILAEILFIRFL